MYGFLLTEKKVVLCARNKAVLTHVAETFRALLHPFEFQHVYIPMLPIVRSRVAYLAFQLILLQHLSLTQLS